MLHKPVHYGCENSRAVLTKIWLSNLDVGDAALKRGFPGSSRGKEPACHAGDIRGMGSIPGWEDPLEEAMATHSDILACRIPWTEEPGGLWSMRSQRGTQLK